MRWAEWASQRHVDDWPAIWHCAICGAKLRYKAWGLCGICWERWKEFQDSEWYKQLLRDNSNREYQERKLLEGMMQYWDDMEGLGHEASDDLVPSLGHKEYRALTHALNMMTPLQARTALMRYFDGLSVSEIARREQVSRRAIQGRIRRGIRRVRENGDIRDATCT